jgi:hypothetical protein
VAEQLDACCQPYVKTRAVSLQLLPVRLPAEKERFMSYYHSRTVEGAFADVVAATIAALADRGFGVLRNAVDAVKAVGQV